MSEPSPAPENAPSPRSFHALGRTEELGRAARAGDQASFAELFERVMPALYVWTQLRLRRGSRGAVEIQDLLQEVWFRALQGFQGYDPSRSFRAWILGIAKNVLLQSYAKRSALPLAASAAASSNASAPGIPDSVTSVSLRLAKDEAIGGFLAYMDALEPDERALLLYCGIEEYTCLQAATRLGISADAATKRWQALRARIRANAALAALASTLTE